MKRLTNLSQTGWRAKHNAAVTISGTYDDACETSGTLTSFYCVLVVCLRNIENCTGFTGMLRSEANALKDKLLDCEVILTTLIYLRIFKYTTPLSDYDSNERSRVCAGMTSSISGEKEHCSYFTRFSTSARHCELICSMSKQAI